MVLPWGKFECQKLPMGLCNSPDIFQEKMNELYIGLEYGRVYIDDLSSWFQNQCGKTFLARNNLEYLGLK